MERIAIIGGGLMGTGIAQVFAATGHDVVIFEPNAEARGSVVERIAQGLEAIGRDSAASKRVAVADNLPQAVAGADYITEAAPEKIDLKRHIFVQLVEYAPVTAILASNSSVIPVTSISEGLATAERMVGTHWWNPAPLIPLVEVIQGRRTADATISATMNLLRRAGKSPAYVRKDVPGFVANRLQHALWREAIAMVAQGICDAETVDACVKNSFGLRLPVLGPLENADLVGLDLTLDIHRTIMPELDRHAGPNEYLKAKVAAGDLGFKTGCGMRSWSAEEMDALRCKLTSYLVAAQRER